MLERNELARAMTELPDELLLDQERTARPQRIVKFRRIIAAAATIALLAVTVGAVSLGFTWKVEPESGAELVEKYEQSCGPLNAMGNGESREWKWIATPWPWHTEHPGNQTR
jgi:hypothetical protein